MKKIKLAAFMTASMLAVNAMGGCVFAASVTNGTISGTASLQKNTIVNQQNSLTINKNIQTVPDEDAENETASDVLITTVDMIDVDDQFTKRDLNWSYDSRDPQYITLNNEDTDVSSVDGVSIDTSNGIVITISEEGVYVFTGTLDDGQIIVNCEDEDAKVQIVLNDVDITNDDGPCILGYGADKIFITLEEDNTLSDTGEEYVQSGLSDKTEDGVIFTDADTTLNGNGTLTVNAEYENAIVCKKDLKITGGEYEINAEEKGFDVNDSVRIADGEVIINAGDDGIHTDEDEDEGKGYVYIEGGTLTISSGDDAIHAATAILIVDGEINITKCYEGIEGDTIDIQGGTIDIKSDDDGLNASNGVSDSDVVYLRIEGGTITVDANDGDGIDSNGDFYLDGGEVYVTGPATGDSSAVDYGDSAEAVVTGGTLVGTGSSDMVEDFSDDCTQYVIMANFKSSVKADSTITLEDEDGNVVIEYTAGKAFDSIVITSPDITEGTYILTAGTLSEEIEVASTFTKVENAGNGAVNTDNVIGETNKNADIMDDVQQNTEVQNNNSNSITNKNNTVAQKNNVIQNNSKNITNNTWNSVIQNNGKLK